MQRSSADLRAANIPRPDVNDLDIAQFWLATARGELRVSRSRTTGQYVWPPRPGAVGESDFGLEWVEVPTSGALFSWTVVHQTGLPGYSELVPYAVGVIQLDEVPVRMVGFIHADPATLVPGERLTAEFVELEPAVVIVTWRRPADV